MRGLPALGARWRVARRDMTKLRLSFRVLLASIFVAAVGQARNVSAGSADWTEGMLLKIVDSESGKHRQVVVKDEASTERPALWDALSSPRAKTGSSWCFCVGRAPNGKLSIAQLTQRCSQPRFDWRACGFQCRGRLNLFGQRGGESATDAGTAEVFSARPLWIPLPPILRM